jgi:hypothetical protein
MGRTISDRPRKVTRVTERFGWECFHCRASLSPSTLTLDHIIPKAQGGSDAIVNLLPSCKHCNYWRDQLPLCDDAMKIIEERHGLSIPNKPGTQHAA